MRESTRSANKNLESHYKTEDSQIKKNDSNLDDECSSRIHRSRIRIGKQKESDETLIEDLESGKMI